MRKGPILSNDQMSAFLPKLEELAMAHISFLAAPHGTEEKMKQSARQQAVLQRMNSDERRAVAGFANSLEWLVTK